MESKRRQQIALAGAAAVVAAGALYMFWPRTTGTARATSNVRAAAGAKAKATQPITAPDGHLDALSAPRPKPDDLNRNLFRFKPKPAPPPAVGSRPAVPPAPPPPPSGPPPPPDFPLKFALLF